ncbi:MAG TPA: enoyl-CoA hydratase-related protein [Nitrospiria bacterium]|nr:enoyl-CoA hydratase-related protein [Nitrospiria bacterium]
MANQFVNDVVEEHVATLTINNPPMNALTRVVMAELESAIDRVAKDPQIKTVVITGTGNMFVAGADIREIAAISSGKMGAEITAKGQAIYNKIEQLQKPVIAAINGLFCLGGGLELVLACHIRIAGDRARLGLPEIDLGIIPGFGGTQRLTRIVGASKAIELILTGDKITAQEAKEIGLVNKVVPDADVLKQAQGLAKKIASKGQVAVRSAMKAIGIAISTPLMEGLKKESELFGLVCETADMKEGTSAFLQKRQPKWQDK